MIPLNKFQNKETAVLFALLNAGLWNRKPDGEALFPLTDEEWNAVFGMARAQTVTGLVYQGMCQLPDEWLPSQKLLLKWVAAVDGIERANQKMNRTLAGLYGMFRREELNPVLQKGQGVALFYEQPLLRECGDIDFYFVSAEDNRRAATLLKEKGVKTVRHADGSMYYECNGIGVEHHVQLMDIRNPFVRKVAGRLEQKQGFRPATLRYEGKTLELTVPAPLLNLMLLNAHIMKHAVGWGIGLRQLCDMARACYSLHPEINVGELEDACKETGMEKWTCLLSAFLMRYLEVPSCCVPYPDVEMSGEPLLDVILKGGNFGMHDGCGRQNKGRWMRKLHTSGAFLRKMGFSCSYVPKETFWIFSDLVKGQFK